MLCDSDTCQIIFNTVFPTLGVIIANIQFASPIKTVLRVRKNGKLGQVNPIPYAFIFINTMAWMIYSYVVENYYIFFANWFGSICGLAFCFVAYSSGGQELALIRLELDAAVSLDSVDKLQHRLGSLVRRLQGTLGVAVIGYALVVVIAMIVFIPLVSSDDSTRQTVMGSTALFTHVMFYTSPLTTLYTVVKTRNSASFDWWLVFASILNAVFWSVYGLFIGDAFVYAPNLVGCVLAGTQLLCLVVLPRREGIELVVEDFVAKEKLQHPKIYDDFLDDDITASGKTLAGADNV
eukprot:Partr_v1_DN28097_c0_g1_i6_m56989 putative sugar transporter